MQDANVIIVGGGASGALVALRLLRAATARRVVWVGQRAGRFGRGLAWASPLDEHLSHEPASALSVDEDAPDDFVSYLREHGPGDAFVPRRLWGSYLDASLQAATRASTTALESVEATAVGLARRGDGWRVSLIDGRHVDAGCVVLATGHERPPPPDAWGAEAQAAGLLTHGLFDPLPVPRSEAPILLLGTGLTMVDVALALSRTPGRSLVAVSRQGWTPTVHRPSTNWELGRAPPLGSLSAMQAWLRNELFEAALAQVSWREVLDRLRPRTPALWAALPLVERRRFLRHGRAVWEVHRHRMAPETGRALASLRLRRSLEVVAGKLENVSITGAGVRARLGGKPWTFAAVVDCRNPSWHLPSTTNPFLRSALSSGYIEPHPVGLGLRASPTMSVMVEGRPVRGLYALGPLLVGERWESTAIAEIRSQAGQLVAQLSPAVEAESSLPAP